MKRDVVDIYLETGDFLKAVKESGLPALQAHIKLMSSGVLKIQDKINYLAKPGKLGGMAEEFFQKLIPDAVDANKFIQKNNPAYDFLLGDLKINVKYSSIRKKQYIKKTRECWNFRVAGNHQVIVAFLEREEGKELDNPYIVVIPRAFFRGNKDIEITKGSQRFKDFVVPAEKLRETLEQYMPMAIID